MAIFSKKSEEVKEEKAVATTTGSSAKTSVTRTDIIISPRVSERSVSLAKANKYVFNVRKNANKLEIRKALQSFYDIKIVKLNILNVMGKTRRYGKATGRTSDYKKVVVTLSKDSKKPSFASE